MIEYHAHWMTKHPKELMARRVHHLAWVDDSRSVPGADKAYGHFIVADWNDVDGVTAGSFWFESNEWMTLVPGENRYVPKAEHGVLGVFDLQTGVPQLAPREVARLTMEAFTLLEAMIARVIELAA